MRFSDGKELLIMTLARNGQIVRRLVASVAIVGLTLGLAACSGEDDPGQQPDTDETSQAAGEETDATDEPSDEPTSTQVEPSMGDDFDGILSDVTTESCPTDKGEVEATGTVLNSSDDARDILITVVWLKKNSGDSVAINFVALKDVPAGETVEWTVPATLDRKAARCVVAAKSNKVGTLK
jgi:hypothetical protein